MAGTSHADIKRVLVTYGDYSMVAAGTTAFVRAGKKLNWNVSPGQIIAFVIENGTTRTVSNATLAAADIPNLYIGVGYASKGGTTDDIRYFGMESISGCYLEKVQTMSPKCGSPMVQDLYFDCIDCDTYAVKIKVDDNHSRAFAPIFKGWAQFTGAVQPLCKETCDDCPVTPDCSVLACHLADALNGDLELKVGNGEYPDWKGEGLPRPYYVTKLHSDSILFCLSPQTADGSCERCNYFTGISSIVVNNTTINLAGTTNPADSTQTLRGQIQNVIDQINQAFEDQYGENHHKGSAYWTGSFSACCPIQIHVNTCDPTFDIKYHNGTSLVRQQYNPFTHYATPDGTTACKSCDASSSAPAPYSCGIRVIAERLEPECGCILPQPKMSYLRTIEIEPYGEGWRKKPWLVRTVQSMELPAMFGAEVQWEEYQNIPGGSGFSYDFSNNLRGWILQPEEVARVNKAVTARCDTDYCGWYVRSNQTKRKITNEPSQLSIESRLYIPVQDTTTQASWKAFLDKLLELSPGCQVLTATECDTSMGNCPTAPGASSGAASSSDIASSSAVPSSSAVASSSVVASSSAAAASSSGS